MLKFQFFQKAKGKSQTDPLSSWVRDHAHGDVVMKSEKVYMDAADEERKESSCAQLTLLLWSRQRPMIFIGLVSP